MNEAKHWLTVKQTAECLGITERAVRLSAERKTIISEYVSGKGKGGKQLRILLESLPEEAQNQYNGVKTKPAQRDENLYSTLSDKQRRRTDEKLLAVTQYKKFKSRYDKKDCRKAFLAGFKADYPDIEISAGKLEDWVHKYNENGLNGLIDLRGHSHNGETSLTKDMQDVFKVYYLSDKKPSIHQCYIATKEVFADKGITVPSESSFKRYVYKHIPYETKELYRNGEKAFDDNVLPAIFTDYNSKNLYSNSMWVADHHKCDVLVKYKDKIIRPWITAFTDFKSRYIVGYIVFPNEPNSDFILDCLAEAVKKHGVPDTFLTDNGKDYKSFDLFNTENDMSIVSLLGSSVRTALPYNAKAKPIERSFRIIEELCKLLPSYIGDRPEHRPTTMKGTNKMIERENKAMDFEEFKSFMDNNINIYHNTPHSGNGMNGKTPLQVYAESFSAAGRKMLNDAAISYIFRRTTRAVTITEHGIKFAELPDVGHYTSTELLMYGIGKKVYARYRTSDVRIISVYSESGEYICEARSEPLYIYGAGKEVQKQVIRENSNRKKALRQKAREAYPDGVEVPSIMEISARRSEAFGAPDFSSIPSFDYGEQLGIQGPNLNKQEYEDIEDDFTYGEENEYLIRLSNF